MKTSINKENVFLTAAISMDQNNIEEVGIVTSFPIANNVLIANQKTSCQCLKIKL